MSRKPLVDKRAEGRDRVGALLALPFVGIAIFESRDLRWTQINDRFCAMLGRSRAELLRRHWSEICHVSDHAAGREALARLQAANGGPVRVRLRFRHADGRDIAAEVELSRIRGRAGRSDDRIAALVAEAAPATTAPGVPGQHERAELKRAEVARQEAEEKLTALVGQSISGIYIIEDGRFTYVNPRLAEIFGYAPAELQGLPALELVDAADRGRVADNIRRRLEGAVASVKYEFRGRRRDGTVVNIGAHGSVATISGQRVIVGTLQDITSRIENEQRRESDLARMEAAMQAAVQTITRIVELRDPYTAGHERRVAELSLLFAREIGMEKDRLRGLAIAGGLHDIGKVGVPVEVLVKPTRLSAAEFQIVREHSAHGYGILRVMDFPWPVADAARQHHERIDGSGYPQGLKGGEIILEARILAVADVIEAMASHRPYRPALGLAPALEEIERGAGRLYDPEVAAVALRMCRTGNFRLPA